MEGRPKKAVSSVPAPSIKGALALMAAFMGSFAQPMRFMGRKGGGARHGGVGKSTRADHGPGKKLARRIRNMCGGR